MFFKNNLVRNATLLVLLLVVVVIVYFRILWVAPYQQGGDLIFHTWFIKQILEDGAIPLTSPTTTTPSLYTFTPLFHIITALIAQFSGLPFYTLFPLLNIVLVAIFLMTLFLLAKQLFHHSSIGVLAIIFFLSFHQEFFYFLPKNLSLVIFLLSISLVIRILKNRRIVLVEYMALYAILLALLFTHLLNASYSFAILLGSILFIIIFTDRKKQASLILAALLLSVISFYLLNQSLFTQFGFPIDTSDPSFVVANNRVNGSIPAHLQIPPPVSLSNLFFLVIVLVGVVSMLGEVRRSQSPDFLGIISFSWFVMSLLFFYQAFGGYNYLSSRAENLLVPIASLFAAFGLYSLFKTAFQSRGVRIIFLLILGTWVLIPSLANLLSPTNPPIIYGFQKTHLLEIEKLEQSLPSGIVLSDPITMYLLTTLADMRPTYEFDHTTLYRNIFIHWEAVQKTFFAPKKELLTYLRSTKPDFLVLSSRTYNYFRDMDPKRFSNSRIFRKVYESKLTDLQTAKESGHAVPYYTVYAVSSPKEWESE